MKRFRLTTRHKTALCFLTLLLILAAGVGIRLAHFPAVPPGLNQDEAGSAYESWSLALTGKDKWGNVWPAYFPSWGSGQNVLLAYLTIPALKLLGLNIFSARIISLIFGVLTLPLMLFTLWPSGRGKALLATLIVALVPWHFMLSRWALESNLLPFFMLLGCALMIRGINTGKKRWIIPALLPLALALYAYGTTIVVLPIFLLLFMVFHFRAVWQHKGSWLIALGLFCVLGFPFFIYFTEHYLLGHNMAWTDHLFFSTPMCASTRLSQVSGGDLLDQNFRFMVNGFDDGGNYNLMEDYRLLFPFCALLGFCGLGLALFKLIGKKGANTVTNPETTTIGVFAAWAIGSCALFFLFDLNVNRFNHFYLPCIVLAVWLLDFLVRLIKWETIRLVAYGIAGIFIIGSTFPAIKNYFTEYPESSIKTDFNSGLKEAFAAIKELPSMQVRISPQMPLPYVYTLFYLGYPPAQFQKEVQYKVQGGVYIVNRFGRYIFNDDLLDMHQSIGFLARKDELKSSDQFSKKITYQNEYWEVGTMTPLH